ncbi:hypothetical protein COUCH_24620 [Couchioplanes caeruleus]|uniref:hypothetical protein n=1 Tax=Couchioplanes caeruleus TaxID=56438 RepID=UPI0020BFFA42|nr:hypothetical protein [Couchioplanes caeruleus]UQU62213.1 hypothetical protein COUCH_24620 [Couchioplanes caeruleus]
MVDVDHPRCDRPLKARGEFRGYLGQHMSGTIGIDAPLQPGEPCEHHAVRLDEVIVAAEQPRGKRWTSISYCVLDAVWSLDTRYDSVVVPAVRRVAAVFGDDHPTRCRDWRRRSGTALVPRVDPASLPTLLADYADAETLRRDANAQITSPHSGLLQAEGALRYSRILVEHEVPNLAAVQT